MANTSLIGAQWGDEGKGKIIDVLTAKADIVVRSQGGNNAGHTVIHRGAKYILHLIPSGILRRGKTCVIGNGVVVDPIALVGEIEGLRKLGITIGKNLLISDCAHLVLPTTVCWMSGVNYARAEPKLGPRNVELVRPMETKPRAPACACPTWCSRLFSQENCKPR